MAQAARDTRLSERSIRELFSRLRAKLIEATLMERHAFGGTGMYLYQNRALSARGRAILEEVSKGPNFAAHRKHHAARFRDPKEKTRHVYEMTVRLFCSIHLPKTPEQLYPDETRQALSQLSEIGAFIRQYKDNPEFIEKYGSVITRYERLTGHFRTLLDKEELLSLRNKSDMHRYSDTVLYDDLRRHLLAYPL
ncbi:hypothetical protein [Woodsholea maritima]|uniref:hypothetical protein n=1 Tax=Woodsholea maritima TaxID=240237 RepID=UPI0012EA3215|nr:hypothetical protein [Woodsholea maritima]